MADLLADIDQFGDQLAQALARGNLGELSLALGVQGFKRGEVP